MHTILFISRLLISSLVFASTALGAASSDRTLNVTIFGRYGRGVKPWKSNNPYVMAMMACVHGRLLKLDNAGKISGDFAKSWDISKDKKTYTFHPKESFVGLAPNVLASLQAATASDSHALHKGLLLSLVKNQKNSSWVRSNAKGEITFQLDHPYPPFPYLLTSPEFSILSEKQLEGQANDGTGAYSFQYGKGEDEIALSRKEPDSAHFSKINILITPDLKKIRSRILAGSTDLLVGMPTRSFDEIIKGSKLKPIRGYISEPENYLFNRRSKIFENADFRKDLAGLLRTAAKEWAKKNPKFTFHPHILTPGIMPPSYYADPKYPDVSAAEFRDKWKDRVEEYGFRLWINSEYSSDSFLESVRSLLKEISPEAHLVAANIDGFTAEEQKNGFDAVLSDGGYLFPDPDSGIVLWEQELGKNFEFPGKPLVKAVEKYRFEPNAKKRLEMYSKEIKKFEGTNWSVPILNSYDPIAKTDGVELSDSMFGLYDVVCGARATTKK